ncbi:MAG: peroxiredoxin [Thermodesulfobacteriota bacterium]
MQRLFAFVVLMLWIVVAAAPVLAEDVEHVYSQEELKPVDSELKVAVGDKAPDFALPSLNGTTVRLSSFEGEQNVVLSFVPAAFTPVCSDQWPGYNLLEDMFRQHNATILGISADNTPSQYAWVQEMGGLWFPVLSDFWPHGEAASQYGLLRSDGTTERALIVVDTQGVIRYIDVHDINQRPQLEPMMQVLQDLS